MAADISREDEFMEGPAPEEFAEGWTEEAGEADSGDPQAQARRKHGRWRSVEEYQEWKHLREELDDLDAF